MLIYDADCVLCSRSANFVARHDRDGRFWYADLASAAGRELAAWHGIDPRSVDALVLTEGARAYVGSTAALRVAGRLGFPWRTMGALLLVPAFLREPVYRFVAGNRHRLFRRSACPIPEPGLRERMLTQAGDEIVTGYERISG